MFGNDPEVCLVEKMSLVLFVFFWVDRDHPRSTCNRISLTGRTADQDPVFCTIQAFRNTSVDLVGWETLIVAKLRIPRFRVSSGAFFWIGLIELLPLQLAAEMVIIFFRYIFAWEQPEKTSELQRFMGKDIVSIERTVLNACLPALSWKALNPSLSPPGPAKRSTTGIMDSATIPGTDDYRKGGRSGQPNRR